VPDAVQLTFDFSWGDSARRFAEAMERVPARLAQAVNHHLDLYGLEFTTRTIVRKRLSGRKDGDKGLYRRDGALADSMRHQVTGSGLADLALSVYAGGLGAKYALVHEYGATIVPRQDRAVTVRRRLRDGSVRTYTYKRRLLTWRAEYGPYKGRWFSARKVVIPPRLEFVKTFREDTARRRTFLAAMLRDALDSTAPIGGGGAVPSEA